MFSGASLASGAITHRALLTLVTHITERGIIAVTAAVLGAVVLYRLATIGRRWRYRSSRSRR
jgi:uncharacterized membrane protein YqjE